MDLSNPQTPRRLVTSGTPNGFPVIARQGNRLACVQRASNFGIWKTKASPSHVQTEPSEKLVSTTRSDMSPRLLPDGWSIVWCPGEFHSDVMLVENFR
jgi:hypothetical protein